MKAIVQHTYGSTDVLEFRDIDRPTIADDEVLVRVRAAGVDRGVWHLMAGLPYPIRLAGYGVRAPRTSTPGMDLAGVVEAVGAAVTRFQPGDEVFGVGTGTYAEFARAREDKLAPKPAALSFEQAAAVPISGLTALQAVRDHGHVQPGQRVLITGASGGVGSYAVQIAKAYGAEVTGVCSTPHVDLVQGLGADQVIDYTREDFTAGTGRYDLVLQLGGTYSATAIRRILTPRGTLIQSYGDGGRWIGPLGHIAKAALLNLFAKQTLTSFTASVTSDALTEITDLIESGHVAPVIGRTFPLAEAAAAVDLVEKGSPPGKVVVLLD